MLLPIKTYYKYAMKNREELKIASKNIGIAKDQVYIAQRSNLPRIDIVGATGHQSQIGLSPCGIIEGPLVQNVPHNFYNIGVQVSWPIFNGLLNNNIEKEAHATMLKEILNKDHSLQEIKFAIDTAYHTLKQALVSIKAKKIDLVYTRNNIKLKKLQFKTGDISKIELDLALADWERAEYTWIDLIVDAAIKEKNLAFACGYPKELF